MKKLVALMAVLVLSMTMIGCGAEEVSSEASVSSEAAVSSEVASEVASEGVADGVMSHAEFVAAALDTEVTVETYVQGKQSWWEDKATIYTQAEDGAYFIYEMACSEEDYAKLTPGTKIKVTGFKAEWAGEVEIIDATFEILEGNFVAEPLDVTALLGTEELIDHQNEVVAFKGMTVKAVEYKNDEPGDDIYVTLSNGEADYGFCVEVYLTGPESEVYTTVGTLEAGDVVDVEGFLYWYEGANPHITAITVVE